MTLLEGLPEPLRSRVRAEADAEQKALALAARAAEEQPSVSVDATALAAYALARAPREGSITEHLEKLRAGDLALAAACARGDAAAIALFEARYFDEVPIALANVRTTATRDEVAQHLRAKLFVGEEGALPKIAQYSGAGDLRAWFRVTVVRTVLNLATRGPKEVELKEAMLAAMPSGSEDPELAHARATYGPALAEALEEALGRLERRERALLRYAVCDGLTVDAIGKVYDVHRATAARWVQAARERLEAEVLRSARARLGAGDDSLRSIMRLLASQVEISLRQHLATTSSAEAPPDA